MSTSWQTKLREAEKLDLKAGQMQETAKALQMAAKEIKAEAQSARAESARLKKLYREQRIKSMMAADFGPKEIAEAAGISVTRLQQIQNKFKRIEERSRRIKEKSEAQKREYTSYSQRDLKYSKLSDCWFWDDNKQFRKIAGEHLSAVVAAERLQEKNALVIRQTATPETNYVYQCATAILELMK